MTQRPKTEAEQLAFFDDTHHRFVKARHSAGPVDHYYGLAGTTVRLCFAGDGLVPYLTPALEHLRIPPVEACDLTLCPWDTESTGVRMPPPPCEQESFTDRGDIWGLDSQRIKTAFHYYDFSVNLFDHERRLGLYWVNKADTLPYWVSASPLRTLFHWWMERNGGQLLHAAAVGTEDGAVLIPGKGGAGKSTTALACLAGGLLYLGDDYLIVRHRPQPTAYSLYSTAKLDPRRLDSFPTLRPFVRARPEDEKAVLFLHPHFRAQIRAEMPLRAVAIPQVTPGREDTRFRPEAAAVAQQAASFTTMSQLPHVGRHTYEFLGQLCSALPCHVAELGRDLTRIPLAIRSFLGEATRPGRRAPAAPAEAAPRRELPLVSVIIPVYNGERFLKDAVESVLAQKYPSLEIIIVDDGSTDGTDAIARALPCDVRYFKQGNSGPAAARNRAIRDTAGEFVAFLDVDDLWPEHTLSMLVDELAARPDLDVVHGYAQLLEYEPVSDSYEFRGNPQEAFAWYIGAALYRKRVFGTVGLFDPTLTFGEDVDWFTRARELQVPMRRLEAVTLHVRRHGRNMTHGKNLLALNMLRVFKKALDRKRDGTADDAGPATAT
jgi:hypothetical protein